MYNENAKKRSIKYRKAHRDKLTIDLPRGYKDKYKDYAEFKGVSLTKLFIDLINKDMEETGFTN